MSEGILLALGWLLELEGGEPPTVEVVFGEEPVRLICPACKRLVFTRVLEEEGPGAVCYRIGFCVIFFVMS